MATGLQHGSGCHSDFAPPNGASLRLRLQPPRPRRGLDEEAGETVDTLGPCFMSRVIGGRRSISAPKRPPGRRRLRRRQDPPSRLICREPRTVDDRCAICCAARAGRRRALKPHAIRLQLGKTPTAMAMVFEGASAGVSLTGEGKQPGIYNYYFGKNASVWRTGVPAYSSVIYKQVYDGVDIRVREQSGLFEYDLLLSPRTDLSRVVIRADGASRSSCKATEPWCSTRRTARCGRPLRAPWRCCPRARLASWPARFASSMRTGTVSRCQTETMHCRS